MKSCCSFRVSSFLALALIIGLGGHLQAATAQPGRLLFDDYYQKPRNDALYPQGVARGNSELRGLSNFYSPEATAIPNGTFVFAELIADKFQVETSGEPISDELLKDAAAYLMACPVRAEHGGRADLTASDAAILERFVARGGALILIANSIPDPEKSGVDFAGLNLIAQKFGVQFLAEQTDTISIPIANDHPTFDGPRDIIFGNGTTLEILDAADPGTQILLESHSEKALGPVAVLAIHGQGKVLLFGDAGTFGNAHAFRSDLDHAQALRQMMFALLPDGPAPRYGWKEGATLQVKVKQEQIVSGYPEFMKVISLPHPKGTEVFTSGMRQIDLDASGLSAFGSKDFVSVVSHREATFDLAIGESDGRGYQAKWSDSQGSLDAKLLPSGRLVNPGMPEAGDLVAWQSLLLNDAIGAPLKAYAQPGEIWSAKGLSSLPQLHSTMAPRMELASSDYTFEGEADYNGTPCYLFSRVTQLDGKDWSPSDLIDPAYAMQFNERDIEIQAGGQLTVAKYWISRDALLPVHTEIKVSAAIWWEDSRFPAKYVGSHDSKNYENWETINFVATYGRVFTADFELR
jgi:hypothetical protein